MTVTIPKNRNNVEPTGYDTLSIRDGVDYLWNAYQHLITQRALDVFQAKVRPYLRSKGMKMTVKDGINYIYMLDDKRKWVEVHPDDLPAWLTEMLDIPIPGIQGKTFGEFIPDYNPDSDESDATPGEEVKTK